ncbi:MAG TPA: hypothetical protein PKD02_09455, partial [Thermomonas sp.]|nr:hypothetical protein [Thermomonas sp.]
MTAIKAARAARRHPAAMVETIEGWRCIGCGKVEATRPCIGVCQDRKVELVAAEDYAELAWRGGPLGGGVAPVARNAP